MYDSSIKMVSSTWFSAESNLEGRRTTVWMVKATDHEKCRTRICSLFCVPTCWHEAVRTPAVAFLEQWSSPPPQSAAQVRLRWPAEMPRWLRFAGISPEGACRLSTINHWSATQCWSLGTISGSVLNSLALFAFKQASLYEVGYCL